VKFKDFTVFNPHFVHLRPFNLADATVNLWCHLGARGWGRSGAKMSFLNHTKSCL